MRTATPIPRRLPPDRRPASAVLLRLAAALLLSVSTAALAQAPDPARLSELALGYHAEAAEIALLSERNDGDAALALGRRLKAGRRISPDNPLRRPDLAGAEAAFRAAIAAGGDAGLAAIFELANLLGDDDRPVEARGEAVELYQRAASAGHGAATAALARIHEDGVLVARDLERARSLYAEALRRNEPEGAFGLARLTPSAEEETARSYVAQGIVLLRRRAERSASAAFGLASRYAAGDGLPQDTAKALALVEEAIRRGRGSDALALARNLLVADGGDGPARARALLVEAELSGSTAAARMLLSDAAEDGPLGVDAELAALLTRHLEEIGDAQGMFVAANLYERGSFAAADPARSAALFQRVLASARDNPADLVRLGRMLAEGTGVSADPEKAFTYYAAAAEAGQAEGMLGAAELALQSGALDGEQLARIVGWLEGAVAGDQARAYVLLGDFYRDGKGVPVSVARAAELYDRAIERHALPAAMERRANLYLEHATSTDDGLRAVALLTDAANAGRPSAMTLLAKQFRYGRFIPKDLAAAERWLTTAADAGYAQALVELGDLYETSPAPFGSPDKARAVFERAWRAGEAEGGLRVGRILRDGGDRGAARQVLSEALTQGNDVAAVELAAIELADGNGDAAAAMVDRALATAEADANAQLAVAQAVVALPDQTLARRGLALLEALDASGDGAATRILAEVHREARLGPFDRATAEAWARKAAARGAVQPLFTLAANLIRGEGPDKDVPGGVALLEEAHRLVPTHMQTILLLARRYQTGGDGVPQDVGRAFALFKSAAEFGSTTGQVLTARAYADGSGTPRNPEQAIYWFGRAAEQGSLEAMMELGRYYAAGEGVKLDAERAFGFFYRAAEGGSAEAMVEVGKSMLVGYGTEQDVARGVGWLEKAAATGSATAMYDLFQFYNLDDPALHDPQKALHWIHEAVDHGSAEAAFRLALLYRDGRLVPKDEGQMRSWLERAVAAGHAYSGKLLARMTPAAAEGAARQ